MRSKDKFTKKQSYGNFIKTMDDTCRFNDEFDCLITRPKASTEKNAYRFYTNYTINYTKYYDNKRSQ